jgi:quercetin dioxygenase-like cupin family protein
MSSGYLVKHLRDIPSVPCPCGSSTRPITIEDTPAVNFHITHITDSVKHYHKEVTEVYYILEGWGTMELGDDTVVLEPGVVILIEPYTPHRGYGDFRAVIVGVPAMKHTDEFFVTEGVEAVSQT